LRAVQQRGEKRQGRDGNQPRISNLVYFPILTESPAAARQAAEGMVPMFQMPPEDIARLPIVLVGTVEEWVAELSRIGIPIG
jgi:hypothetical protein